MKVLNLCCEQAHVFEGWFASEDDFLQQQSTGLLQCPVCASSQVQKRLSAPRLNLGKGSDTAPDRAEPSEQQQQAAALQAMRAMVASAHDVGEDFAQEARRIHQGESDLRSIRGQATPAQARELLDEGIEVLPVPALLAAKNTLQ